MEKAQTLQPGDVVVALRLVQYPEEPYESLSGALGIGVGTAHRAVARLTQAALLVPDSRRTIAHNLLEFLVHGLRYTFFAALGPESMGVPTGPSAPALSNAFAAERAWVWPYIDGRHRGDSVRPLVPQAPGYAETAPALYDALSLLDAIRIGGARERKRAQELIQVWLEENAGE